MVTAELDQDSAEPLYAQLVDRFRGMITSGALGPGDRFPPELDLMREYGVARITVRRAIGELVREGLLTRSRGKGSFVAAPKIQRAFVNVASFSERMQAQGVRASTRVVHVRTVPATASLAAALDEEEGDPIAEVRRLRLANDEPAVLETSYLSLRRCPGIQDVNLSATSLYAVLEKQYGLKPASSRRTLELTFATADEAQLLHVAARAPLFLLTATVYTADGTPLEHVKELYRSDRFRFQV